MQQHSSISPPVGRRAADFFDGLPVRGLHAETFFLLMAAYFFQQFANWNFGFIAPALRETWHLEAGDLADIAFWYFIGMTAGGVLGGIISDRIGRRPVMLGAILVISAASLLTCFTTDVRLFTFFRALTGFGVFCLMVVSTVYIAEISPAESRGERQCLTAAAGFCAAPLTAMLCGFVLVSLGRENGWRFLFCFGGFGLVPFIWGLTTLRESPRWLAERGRLAEAEAVMRELTGADIALPGPPDNAPTRDAAERRPGPFGGGRLGRTLLLALLFATSAPAGFLIMVWTPQLLTMRGCTLGETLTVVSVITIGVPAGCLLGARFAERGGRKGPLAASLGASAAFALLFGGMNNLVALSVSGFLMAACCLAAHFILFAYAAESYPTRARGTAVGLHHGLARLAVSASQFAIPGIFAAYGFFGAFASVALLFFLPVIPLVLWGLRTAGKNLEELE